MMNQPKMTPLHAFPGNGRLASGLLDKLGCSLFPTGDWNIQIIMSQIRLEFSNLNSHLNNKLCPHYVLTNNQTKLHIIYFLTEN